MIKNKIVLQSDSLLLWLDCYACTSVAEWGRFLQHSTRSHTIPGFIPVVRYICPVVPSWRSAVSPAEAGLPARC